MELSYLTGGMRCSEWIIHWVKSYLATKADLVRVLLSLQSFDWWSSWKWRRTCLRLYYDRSLVDLNVYEYWKISAEIMKDQDVHKLLFMCDVTVQCLQFLSFSGSLNVVLRTQDGLSCVGDWAVQRLMPIQNNTNMYIRRYLCWALRELVYRLSSDRHLHTQVLWSVVYKLLDYIKAYLFWTFKTSDYFTYNQV